jgi:hypothetical protein
MKRLKQQEQGGKVRGVTGPQVVKVVTEGDLAQVAGGDLYLHNPRGSNDRSNGG